MTPLLRQLMNEQTDKLGQIYNTAIEAHIIAVIRAGYVIDRIELGPTDLRNWNEFGGNRTVITKCGTRLKSPTQRINQKEIVMSHTPIPERTGTKIRLDPLEAISTWLDDKTAKATFKIRAISDQNITRYELEGVGGTMFPNWLNDVKYFEGEKQQALDDIVLLKKNNPSKIQKDIDRYKNVLANPPTLREDPEIILVNAVVKFNEAELKYRKMIDTVREGDGLTYPDWKSVASAADRVMNAVSKVEALKNGVKMPTFEDPKEIRSKLDVSRYLQLNLFGAASRMGVTYYARRYPFDGVWSRETPPSDYTEFEWSFS